MIRSATRFSRPLRVGATLLLALLIVGIGGSRPTAAAPPAPAAGSPTAPLAQQFEDVADSNTFAAFINSLRLDGIVSGYTCGGTDPPEPCGPQNLPYYRPANTVTRAQMAKFVDNARHLPGISIDTATDPQPIYANTGASTGIAIEGVHGAFAGPNPGVRGATASFDSLATGVLGVVVPVNPGTLSAGVRGINNGTGTTGVGVYGMHAGSGYGVYGLSTTGIGGYFRGSTAGLVASATSTSYLAEGIQGTGFGDATGVAGLSANQGGTTGIGVAARHQGGGTGLYASSVTGRAVVALSNGTGVNGAALNAVNTNAGGYAGYFQGDVNVTGACCAAAMGTYRIDHPQDPAHQYLTQAAVASPDLLDVINGNVTLDAKGTATVALPAWFIATTAQYRYQLTAVSAPGPGLYISRKVATDGFSIAGGAAGGEVSWQVTGVRNDPYAAAHRLVVEAAKPADAQGTYLQPELYGQPETARYGAAPVPGK